MITMYKLFLPALLAVVLTACGGGGDSAAGTSKLGGAISSGDGTGTSSTTVAPLYTTAPNSVLMGATQASQSFQVRGGVAPYVVSTSNANVVNVLIASAGDTSDVTITPVGQPGSAVVVIFDSRGSSTSFNVNVGAIQSLFTTSPPKIALGSGGSETGNVDVGGGVPNYYFSTSDANVASAIVVDGDTFKIKSVRPGVAQISVKDRSGNEVVISVTVVADLPLETSMPPAVTLGTSAATNSATFGVSGGVAPYTVVSSATGVVGAPSNSVSSSFTLIGLAAGTSTITVSDSSSTPKTLSRTVNVQQTAALSLTASPAALSGVVGTDVSFAVSGGVPVTSAIATTPKFTIKSNNTSVATIASEPDQSNGLMSVRLSLASAGTAVVTLTDSIGAIATVAVNVVSATVQPLSISAPASLTLAPGETFDFSIAGGTGSYNTVSGNTTLATVTNSSTAAPTLTAKTGVTGTVQIDVIDSANARQSFSVTVQSAPLSLSAPAGGVSLRPGGSASYQIIGGITSFLSPTSSDPSVATASLSGASNRTLTVNAGSASATPAVITVTDAVGAQVALNVTVSAAAAPSLALSPASVTGAVGDVSIVQLAGGTSPYVVSSSNTTVLTASSPDADGKITLTLVRDGSATLTVKDATGQIQTVAVTITTQPTQLQVSPYSMVVSEGFVGALPFKVAGGSGTYIGYLSDTRKATVGIASSTVTVTSTDPDAAGPLVSTMCSATSDTLITSTVVNTDLLGASSVKGYDLILTVVDSLGAQAFARIFVTDGACP
jgi:hypothetical protein